MKVRQMMIQVTALSVGAIYLTSLFLFPGIFSLRCRADGCDPGPDAPGGIAYCNGDANGDKKIDLSDAVTILQYLFLGGPQPVAFAACTRTPQECEDLEFGRCVAGSYIFRMEDGIPVTLAFGANGSLVAQFSPSPSNPLGTWWVSGPRETTAVTVGFIEDNGEVAYTGIRRYVSQFNEDCSTQTLDMHLDVYAFPANPTAAIIPPQGAPVYQSDSQHTAQKVR